MCVCVCVCVGHLGRVLLLRMHAAGKGPGRVSEDYQPGQLADGPLLPEEEFPQSLMVVGGSCCIGKER